MLTEEFSIQAEGSRPGAKLCTYILDASEEFLIQKRPLILICPGGGYAYTSAGRLSQSRCGFWQWAAMWQYCAIRVPLRFIRRRF